MVAPLVVWGGYLLITAVVVGVGGIVYTNIASSDDIDAGRGLSSMYMNPNWTLVGSDTFESKGRDETCASAHSIYVWTDSDGEGRGKEVIVGFEPQERQSRKTQTWDGFTWYTDASKKTKTEWEYANQVKHQVSITLKRKNADGQWETLNDNLVKGGNPENLGGMAYHLPLELPGQYEIQLSPVSSGSCYMPTYQQTYNFSFDKTVWEDERADMITAQKDERLNTVQSNYEAAEQSRQNVDKIITLGGVAMLGLGIVLIIVS